MPGPHKGVSTECTTQQQYTKPRHQPSNRDQQARDRLRNKISESKTKIKSCAYLLAHTMAQCNPTVKRQRHRQRRKSSLIDTQKYHLVTFLIFL